MKGLSSDLSCFIQISTRQNRAIVLSHQIAKINLEEKGGKEKGREGERTEGGGVL